MESPGLEEETLPLDLTGVQAAVLVVIASRSMSGFKELLTLLHEEQLVPQKERAEQVGDDLLRDHIIELELLIENSQLFIDEAGKIVVELDNTEPKSLIIMKPNFGK